MTMTSTPQPTWPPVAPSRSKHTLSMPKIPILIMPPDMRADTFDGAAGWAWGSQEWNGTMPALAPNPKKASTKAMVAVAGAKAQVR